MEQIHLLGRVQSFGCLVALSSDWRVAHASESCATHLGIAAETLIGAPFVSVFPEATVHDLRSRMQALVGEDAHARLFAYDVFGDGRRFDIAVHLSGRLHAVEFEPRSGSPSPGDESALVQALMARMRRMEDIERMAREAARVLRALTGMDRVMVYRFEADGSGTVIAEDAAARLEPYLDLRYPASDIPRQARALHTRSTRRLVADVDDPGSPVQPALGADGQPLDLSLSVTRAVSPVHLEYLRNMGVGASLSASILRRGALWGLFACHHGTPLTFGAETRVAVELFAQLFSYELAQLELEAENRDLDRARSLHDQLMAQLSSGADLCDDFDGMLDQIGAVIPFDGAALSSGGIYRAAGAAPDAEEFESLARFLNTRPTSEIFATDRLIARFPPTDGFATRLAGLLALPVSRRPRDDLVLFRRELARTATWAGDPEKPVEPDGIRLSPRKSFAAAHPSPRPGTTPQGRTSKGPIPMLDVTGLFGLIVLALDLWALISVIGSRAGTGAKVLWCLAILLLPVLGFLIWLYFGPRSDQARA